MMADTIVSCMSYRPATRLRPAMSTRPRRHPIDPERPAIPPSGPRATLPPRPPVPYNHDNTWRAPNDRQYQSPGGYRDDRDYRPGPSYSGYSGQRAYLGDSSDGPIGHGSYNARAGPSWQPTESHRPQRQSSSTAQRDRSATSTRSPPAPNGSYVPLHLRDPIVNSRAPIQQPYPPPLPTQFGGSRQSPAPVFEIPLPDQEYMELSAPFIPHEEEDPVALASKLLVLDLNGTLIYRNKGGSNSRTSYPRPFLGCFFKYLYRPLADRNASRPWEVFVWSSAQPHNVRTMLESTFDPEHIKGLWGDKLNEDELDLSEDGKVLGVWARDKMGLSDQEYCEQLRQRLSRRFLILAHKTQTTKDLRKVETHFESDTGFKRFPLETILLLDDSPLKAVHQPWNQLVLPEYDRDAYQASHRAVDDDRSNTGAECDEILLAVIGILEATSSCENIPAWIRAGGLKKPDIHLGADKVSDDPMWFGAPDGPASGIAPALDSLPTHESFTHWFQDDKLLNRWIDKGKEALKLYDIPLEHGLVAPSPSARSSPAPHSSKSNRRNGLNPPGHTVPAERRRGYSPSRPSTDLNDDMSNLSVSVSPQPDPSRTTSDRLNGANRGRSDGQSRSFSTTRPASHGTREDSWRTFSSIEVSTWLADLSERSSLNEQERDILSSASMLIRGLDARDEHARYEDVPDAGGDVRMVVDPFMAADITDDFFNSTSANGPGFSEADRANRQKHVAAKANGAAALNTRKGSKNETARLPEVVSTSKMQGSVRAPSRQAAVTGDIVNHSDDEPYHPEEEYEDDFMAEDPEPVNAQYPLDHPTSTYDLPAFLLRGNALSKIEIARYFARAAGNRDPIQQQLLGDLLDWEVKHEKASEKLGTDKPPHPQMIGSSLRHMDKLRQKIIANEDIRDMKNARIAERRKEIKQYRDRGLVPPPPRKAPNYRQQRPKTKHKLDNRKQNHQDMKPKTPFAEGNEKKRKSKKEKKREQEAAALGNQSASRPDNRAEGVSAGPSLVSTPGPSTRVENKTAKKGETQTRLHSSKRRASDASGGPSVKIQRVN